MAQHDDYRIELHVPGVDDYLRLRQASGLSTFSREAAEKGLPNSIFGVCLMHGGAVVGMGRIIGDGGCFFQVTDIAIMPEHQGRGLGKMIMAALTDYIEKQLPKTAYVSLIADVPANRLYKQFGFAETAPRSVGMARKLFDNRL
ncbi:N-acetyltransferase [Neorhizobium lilium]|uniref:N-acetyltransferase n=1 Tax=Neorhizobium lilium TaxID=2503024 RepID=A0A3S3T3V4_9HYPH|nr:GNAT family N-acetyltransferase [Neorhizobium lilium]RWX81475.1 N-acetyltransferase [Neorhizobium lilium]